MGRILTALGIAMTVLALGISPAMAADEATAPAAAPAAAPAVAPAATAEEKPKIFAAGSKAEGLMVKDDTGAIVDLVKLAAGSKSMIVFMNTACSACLGEVGMTDALAKRFTKAKLFVVASDFGPYQKIADYKERNKFGGNWVQDEDFAVAPKFGFSFTPAMVVLDETGTVALSVGGYMKSTAKKIEDSIVAILRK